MPGPRRGFPRPPRRGRCCPTSSPRSRRCPAPASKIASVLAASRSTASLLRGTTNPSRPPTSSHSARLRRVTTLAASSSFTATTQSSSVDKPAGLLTVATDSEKLDTLYARLTTHDSGWVKVVHRLDRDTSGVVLFARSAAVRDALQRDWAGVEKTYLAWVAGRPASPAGRVESHLLEAVDLRVRAVPAPTPGAKWAASDYRVLSPGAVSLVEVKLVTGRKHQIRVHMASLGCPLVGDSVYGRGGGPGGAVGAACLAAGTRAPGHGGAGRVRGRGAGGVGAAGPGIAIAAVGQTAAHAAQLTQSSGRASHGGAPSSAAVFRHAVGQTATHRPQATQSLESSEGSVTPAPRNRPRRGRSRRRRRIRRVGRRATAPRAARATHHQSADQVVQHQAGVRGEERGPRAQVERECEPRRAVVLGDFRGSQECHRDFRVPNADAGECRQWRGGVARVGGEDHGGRPRMADDRRQGRRRARLKQPARLGGDEPQLPRRARSSAPHATRSGEVTASPPSRAAARRARPRGGGVLRG